MNAMRGTKSRLHFVPFVPPLQGLVDVWGRFTRPFRPGYPIAGFQPRRIATLPDVLKLPPISPHGNVNEIIGKIVAELDALQAEVDALKRLQAETAAELDALLPAILDRAFKGEL